ncbi:MAG: response regulator [Proteobacteria bacterium]|nr:response regulator [Pseudomonadota bacterium]
MRVLLIEDDQQLGKALYHGLKQDYATDWFRSAEEGEDALRLTSYDAIALDINLPGLSGLEWLKDLRRRGITIPVLLLTARDTTQERITGLDTGADDYLTKPFDFDELMARLRALMRRREAYQPQTILHGPLMLEILRLLVEQAGSCVSKEIIENNLYGWDNPVGSNTIEVHISSLRRKLGKQHIKTMRSLGYVLEGFV